MQGDVISGEMSISQVSPPIPRATNRSQRKPDVQTSIEHDRQDDCLSFGEVHHAAAAVADLRLVALILHAS